MFRCDNCERYFDEGKVIHEETGIGMGSFREEKSYEVCPHCGSEDFTDAQLCELCGEPTSTAGNDFCDDCIEELTSELKLAVVRWRIKKENALNTVIEDAVARDLFWEVMEKENETDFITSSYERRNNE